MAPLDRRTADFQILVRGIRKQLQCVNVAAANGSHIGSNMQELRVIEFLGNEGPSYRRDIIERNICGRNRLKRIVKDLEDRELVRRHRYSEIWIWPRIELTDSGREIYQSLVEVNLRLFRTMLGALTEDEQEIFMVLFRKIARAGRTQVHQIASSA